MKRIQENAKKPKVVFISGSYRAPTPAGIVSNAMLARKYAIKYWQLGFFVICPHTNSFLFDGICNEEVWLDGYLEILSRCDAIVMIPGWTASTGATAEYKFAKENNIEIIYDQEVFDE